MEIAALSLDLPSANRRERQRLGGAAVAIVAHAAAAAALLLWPHTPKSFTGPASVRVTLVSAGPSGARTAAPATVPAPSTARLLSELAAGVGSAETAAAFSPSSPVGATKLADILGDGRASLARSPAPAAANAGPAHSDGLDNDPFGHASLAYADGKPTNAIPLWPEVALCWRKAADAPPVRVRVMLDEVGRVIGAPKPLRPALARLDPVRADAEARAIEAIRACAPYATTATRRPNTPYDLDFR